MDIKKLVRISDAVAETKAQKRYKEALDHFKDSNFYAALYCYLSYWFPRFQKQGENVTYPNPTTIDGNKVELRPSGSSVILKVNGNIVHNGKPKDALDFIKAYIDFDKDATSEGKAPSYSKGLFAQRKEIEAEGKNWGVPASLAKLMFNQKEFKKGSLSYSESEFKVKEKSGEIDKEDYERVGHFYFRKNSGQLKLYKLATIDGVKSLLAKKYLKEAMEKDGAFHDFVMKAFGTKDRNLNIVSYKDKVYYVDVTGTEPQAKFYFSKKQRSY